MMRLPDRVEVVVDVRIRRAPDGGSLYGTPLARRRDVLAFAEMVIADAARRFGRATVVAPMALA
jgi:hypothetical protein